MPVIAQHSTVGVANPPQQFFTGKRTAPLRDLAIDAAYVGLCRPSVVEDHLGVRPYSAERATFDAMVVIVISTTTAVWSTYFSQALFLGMGTHG